MANEIEMIRQQMQETRAALGDKIGKLKRRVADGVEGLSAGVSETVGSVQDLVRGTAQTVTDSVHQTAAALKDACDLRRHVARRPWTMVAGATACGVVGGYLLHGGGGRAGATKAGDADPLPVLAGAAVDRPAEARDVTGGRRAVSRAASNSRPTVFSRLGVTFQAEIAQLKGLAVGTLLSLVRDVVAQSLSRSLEQPVTDMIDGITIKLGGQPVRAPVFPRKSATERRPTVSAVGAPAGRRL